MIISGYDLPKPSFLSRFKDLSIYKNLLTTTDFYRRTSLLLSAENGAGWLCGQAGTAGAEGVGLSDASKQQQLESADPQSA